MAFTAPQNSTTATETFQFINNNWVDGFLFPGIIITVYIIILGKQLTNPGNSFAKSFASASFICMILSVFARVLDLASTSFMVLFVMLTALSGVILFMSER